jgi:hypothetical protein
MNKSIAIMISIMNLAQLRSLIMEITTLITTDEDHNCELITVDEFLVIESLRNDCEERVIELTKLDPVEDQLKYDNYTYC